MNKVRNKNPRNYVYWLILGLIPILFFLVLEGAARVAKLGNEYPLFVSVENQPNYLQPNPDVIKRFFSRPELAPSVSPNTSYFLAKKPTSSFRIVVMGESSAAGFPFGRFASLAGMLEQRFKLLYPEMHIEIINIGMSAINTYAIRDFTDEVISIKPDVILIYTGHNEYLGVMGVGSSMAARDSRWKALLYLSLRQSHFFQFLDSSLAAWRISGSDRSASVGRTLMATVAKNKNISLDSDAYSQGVQQFERNLNDIVSAYRSASIPVVLGTLASNEKDQAPFASQHRNDLSLVSAIESVNLNITQMQYDKAYVELNDILGKFPESADGFFLRGKVNMLRGDITSSRKDYLMAKDLDLLRFRAPEIFNEKIKKLSKQPGVVLADVQSVLAKKSNNIIGFEVMLEHLHPNSDGYFWLAEAFYDALMTLKLLPNSDYDLSSDVAIKLKPLHPIDEIIAEWKVRSLTSDYPFTDQPIGFEIGPLDSPERKLAEDIYKEKVEWLQSELNVFDYYQKQQNWMPALITISQLSDGLPMNAKVALTAAKVSKEVGLIRLVLFYSERGLRTDPANQELLMFKAEALFVMRRMSDSKSVLEQIVTLNPGNTLAKQLLSKYWSN